MYHPDSEYIIRGEHLKSDMLLCKELCGGGLLVREGKQLVAIDPRTGKTKLSISAALSMSITWGDHPQYWNIEDPVEGSPFEAVAQLRHVWWFDVRADNIICMLPPGRYSAAWRLSCNGYITWQPEPVVSTIALAGEEEQRGAINVLEGMPELPEWLEWKFAEIEVGPQGPGGSGRGRGSSEGIDCRLNVQLKDYSNCYKTGLLVDSLVLAQIS